MKHQNTPTNTLEELLYSYRYDSQSIDEDLVLQQDPSDVEKAHQSNLEEAKQAIESLISEEVNKARIDELATLKDYIAVEWKHNSDSWCAGADAKSRDTQEYIANRIEELTKTNTHMEGDDE